MPLPLTGKLTFKSLTPPDLRTCTRAEVRTYFENTYDLDESLFQGIANEAFYLCPDRLRLPLIFYYVHPAAVYVNKLMLAGLLVKRPNPEFEALFETGVDEMSWDDTENYRMGGSFKWPDLKSAFEYRKTVRQLIINIINTVPLTLPVTQESPWWTLFLGFEHERIHLETSSVLMRQLPIRLVKPPAGWTLGPREGPEAPVNALVAQPGGVATLGKPRDFPSFGWDNEYGKAEMEVPPFAVSRFVITNAEFLEFVEAGGYTDPQFWTPEGWRWVTFREAKHPTFWVCEAGCKSGCGAALSCETHCLPADTSAGEPAAKKAKTAAYRYRTVFEVIDMPWTWPADVNYLEAKAYCLWRGQRDGTAYRLPTEAEYLLLRDPVPAELAMDVEGEIIYQNKDGSKANVNMVYHSSTPVNLYPPARSGVYDIHGNVWQWVEDHFNGLPGFRTHYVYDDFSSPCFDARHTMILSGSFIATGDEASRFARFAFRRHFFQHCGFRIVQSDNPTPVRLTCFPDEPLLHTEIRNATPANIHPSTNMQLAIESNDRLRATIDAEYGANAAPADQAAELVRQAAPAAARMLFIGAATGGVPLRLSAHVAQQIVATDYWGKAIEFATQLGAHGTFTSPLTQQTAECPPGSAPNKVIFKQLTWLPQEIGVHDTAVFYRYFERALNADAWFPRVREVIASKGRIVVIDQTFAAADLEPKWAKIATLERSEDVQHGDETVHVSVWTRK